MRTYREVPEAIEAIESGRLTLTSLAQAQSYFRQEKKAGHLLSTEEKREVLKSLEGLSSRECRQELAPTDEAGMEKISFHASPELQGDLKRIRELWGNQDLTPAEMFQKMAKLVLERIDPEKRAAALKQRQRKEQTREQEERQKKQEEKSSSAEVDHSNAVGARQQNRGETIRRLEDKNQEVLMMPALEGVPLPEPPAEFITPESRHIPEATKREVWIRDRGQCTHQHPDGTRCASRYALQFDHIIHYSHGGSHHASNLRLLCRAHHRARDMRAS